MVVYLTLHTCESMERCRFLKLLCLCDVWDEIYIRDISGGSINCHFIEAQYCETCFSISNREKPIFILQPKEGPADQGLTDLWFFRIRHSTSILARGSYLTSKQNYIGAMPGMGRKTGIEVGRYWVGGRLENWQWGIYSHSLIGHQSKYSNFLKCLQSPKLQYYVSFTLPIII